MEKETSEPEISLRWKRVVRWFLIILLFTAFCWFVLPWFFPLSPGLLKKPAVSPVLLDRNGRAIHHLTSEDFTRSAAIGLSSVPQTLIDCTLAAEDKRFFTHHGIDIFATGRSGYDFLRKRKVVSGASTITQQLAKISAPPAPRNIAAKFREAMVARRLEMSWEKSRILEAYFQRLDYGNLRIGPSEAARFYFQKPLSDLSLGECALLAGLPQAPSRLNPLRHPERAMARREIVLDRLAVSRKYSQEEIDLARQEPLSLRPLIEAKSAPWLNRRPGSGNHVRSTLDLDLQKDLEQIVSEETARLKDSNLRHAAVVVIENRSGDILAMVSSADWNDPRGGQLHGALTPRSPGSALKPFTYLLGFRHLDHLPSTVLADVPMRLQTSQGLQLPENYDRKYRGPVTIRHALACSLNIPALRELESLGGAGRLHDFLQSLGIGTLHEPPAFYGLGLTLGNAPVKLLELTNAYASIARMGNYLPSRLFMDEKKAEPEPLIEPEFAWMIADILSDKEARAPSFSTGGPLDLPFRCAVKTGTSSDFRDNWCIGFTPRFTVGVWAGNFENQPMKNISGVSGAGPIFHRALVRAEGETAAEWYDRPEGGQIVRVDPRTGKRIEKGKPGKFSREEWIPEGRGIPIGGPSDYDGAGRAKLPPVYSQWYRSGQNFRRDELIMDDSAENEVPLKIYRPLDGSTILLDPEIPGNQSELRLLTNFPDLVSWRCATLKIDGEIAHLVEGEHVLIATDSRDGAEHIVTIRVKKL
ncbi:transglycosylase domain-containing protein [Luteolibacter algae]|uniref:peptidoglycan glycosyltransferase n=1 Tax=Luteolibacter algae TaxID=454151 RepID=A0ABW5D7R4_9BACT